jgi:hypothetical protein
VNAKSLRELCIDQRGQSPLRSRWLCAPENNQKLAVTHVTPAKVLQPTAYLCPQLARGQSRGFDTRVRYSGCCRQELKFPRDRCNASRGRRSRQRAPSANCRCVVLGRVLISAHEGNARSLMRRFESSRPQPASPVSARHALVQEYMRHSQNSISIRSRTQPPWHVHAVNRWSSKGAWDSVSTS